MVFLIALKLRNKITYTNIGYIMYGIIDTVN